jgi:hypothetical protein
MDLVYEEPRPEFRPVVATNDEASLVSTLYGDHFERDHQEFDFLASVDSTAERLCVLLNINRKEP